LVLLILIAACICMINKSSKTKKTPFEIWNEYYSHKPQEQNVETNKDIHHFYNKTPRPSSHRLSIAPSPGFTPHVSSRVAFRNSQISSQRNSLSPNRNIQMHNNHL
jgi:hypothetical protein